MSKRHYLSFLLDIKLACERIFEYTKGLDEETFYNDYKTIDVVVRNLEIIGEAVKYIPEDIRESQKDIPWKKNNRFAKYFDSRIFWC